MGVDSTFSRFRLQLRGGELSDRRGHVAIEDGLRVRALESAGKIGFGLAGKCYGLLYDVWRC